MVNRKSFTGVTRVAAFTIIIMLIVGFVIPGAISLITESIDPGQAEGNPITINGTVYGSYYLAEAFNLSIFFQPRPSAINYNLSQSGSYNYSLDNPALLNITKNYIDRFLQMNPNITISQITEDMVSYSGSGLDPNIQVQDALIQVPRISQNLSLMFMNHSVFFTSGKLNTLLDGMIKSDEAQNFPIFGSYYINTVQINVQIIELLMQKGIIDSSFLN
ncbi:MAG: potassium-transporting ATPase subunit C [Candidatus Thermoplasmatota archaeon]|jgi:K+-transporting ATPase ATPase C chain|nr:potassium-transporting ATPase subunit C [Candidatus Thermoplasmatota archaeon]